MPSILWGSADMLTWLFRVADGLNGFADRQGERNKRNLVRQIENWNRILHTSSAALSQSNGRSGCPRGESATIDKSAAMVKLRALAERPDGNDIWLSLRGDFPHSLPAAIKYFDKKPNAGLRPETQPFTALKSVLNWEPPAGSEPRPPVHSDTPEVLVTDGQEWEPL